jgi:hypothetical protein
LCAVAERGEDGHYATEACITISLACCFFSTSASATGLLLQERS